MNNKLIFGGPWAPQMKWGALGPSRRKGGPGFRSARVSNNGGRAVFWGPMAPLQITIL